MMILDTRWLVVIEIALVIAAIIFSKVEKRNQETSRFIRGSESEKGEISQGRAGASEPAQYLLLDLEIATNNFSDENKIGSGGFGVVYKGTINGRVVAIKKLVGSSIKLLVDIEKEISLLSSLENNNLVKLLGFCSEAGNYLLVYEHVQNGDISNCLIDETKRQALDWEKRFKIIKGIAEGLCYLHHGSDHKIIHCDVKPENILLDDQYNAKIADFGLSRILEMNKTHITAQNLAGTLGYIAPELWFEQRYSTRSDVYSYGLLVLEVAVGSTIPQYAQSNQDNLTHVVWKQYRAKKPFAEVIDPCLRDKSPQDQVSRCIQIGLLCVQNNHRKRPTMEAVLEMLCSECQLRTPSLPAFFEEEVQDERAICGISAPTFELQPALLPKLFSLHELKVATNNFCKNNIGRRYAKSVVYKGDLDGQTVAIEKYLETSVCNQLDLQKVSLFLACVRHPHVVKFLGYCFEENKLLFVSEYFPHGCLSDYLNGHNSNKLLDWSTRLKIINGVAAGLCYLHYGLKKKIIHSNLGSHNILLDEEWNARITNFSPASILYYAEHLHGTANGCMAPKEVFQKDYLAKSDVYRFGLTMIEILVGCTHSRYTAKRGVDLAIDVWNHWRQRKTLEMLDPFLQNECPEEAAIRCFQIALLCVQHDRKKRPNMKRLVQMLNTYDDALPAPSIPGFITSTYSKRRHAKLLNEILVSVSLYFQ